MNPRYAVFIWGSYGLTLAVLMWNVFVPALRRGDLKRHGIETDDAAGEDE